MTVKDIINSRQYRSFLFFWGHTETPGMITKACLSQWYDCVFEVNGILYSSAEQFMMSEKARIMGDETTRSEILASEDTRKIKKLGRCVKNFNSKLWDERKFDIVVNGNYAKFSQNENLRDFLLGTGDDVLVEASPYDDIWGIGMSASDPDVTNPAKWRGYNLLGFALMHVRDMIKEELKSLEIKSEDLPDETTRALRFWTLGVGNMAKAFNGEDPMPDKSVIATEKSWTTRPMPSTSTTIQLNVKIPTSAMEVIKRGHIPEAMEDHWFMYCDENTIRYYRSWTGICVYIAEYKIDGDVTYITSLRVNRDPEQYRGVDDNYDFYLFMAMLITEYGGNAELFWDLALM